MNRKYQKIILYAEKEKYEKAKEKLKGIPVSVWFRKRLDELLEKQEEVDL